MAAWKNRFEDTAYFEPFYLKKSVATVSAKNSFDALRQTYKLGCYM